MADGTKIEWCDATLNFVKARHRVTGKVGDFCIKVSYACAHCYAETNNVFRGTGLPYKPGHLKDVEIFLDEAKLLRPLGWTKPRRIFPLSLTDMFADFVPDWMIDRFFAVAALTPHHTYMPLTKRSARMRAYMANAMGRVADATIALRRSPLAVAKGLGPSAIVPLPHVPPGRVWWPLPNVWLGVSAEDQETADERVADLLATSAAVRVVSAEPLLGDIRFDRICLVRQKPGSIRAGIHLDALSGRYVESGCRYIGEWDVDGPYPAGAPTRRLDGIIVGGESGPGARSMHPAWARSIREQCAAAGTAFLFKQWGAWAWAPEHHNYEDAVAWIRQRYGKVRVQHHSDGRTAYRIGKKRAGRLLDGRTYDAQPDRFAA